MGQITISEKQNQVPKEVFNVVAFGAIPDDGIDDTPAILTAVAKLKKHGGGELFFPRGRFQMTETIELPPHSALRGRGAEYSQTIRNVTLRMLYSEYINNDLDELKRRLPLLHYVRALRLAGENVSVTGNDIYCARAWDRLPACQMGSRGKRGS